MKRLILIALAASALSACATTTPPTKPVVTASPVVSLRIRQTLASLQIAEHQILVQRDNADAGGLLTGATRATVFSLTNRAGPLHQAVLAAETASAAANATTFDAQVAAAYSLIAQVSVYLPKVK